MISDNSLSRKFYEIFYVMQATYINTSTGAPAKTVYICADCHKENSFGPKDHLTCKHCAYRVFYKKRTDKVVQFDAR
ncbi:metallothionein-I gene transcription activator [Blastocladiella britannica]|nr:metallothionein-I gene transcription activator [Blastocladiella britannica]